MDDILRGRLCRVMDALSVARRDLATYAGLEHLKRINRQTETVVDLKAPRTPFSVADRMDAAVTRIDKAMDSIRDILAE